MPRQFFIGRLPFHTNQEKTHQASFVQTPSAPPMQESLRFPQVTPFPLSPIASQL